MVMYAFVMNLLYKAKILLEMDDDGALDTVAQLCKDIEEVKYENDDRFAPMHWATTQLFYLCVAAFYFKKSSYNKCIEFYRSI